MKMAVDWDYKKHGTDWNFTDCNVTNTAQSPVDITLQNVTGDVKVTYYDW